jgi:hypothetical protein
MFNKNSKIFYDEKHLAMLQTNLDTLLFCRKLLCRKLLQVPEYGPCFLRGSVRPFPAYLLQVAAVQVLGNLVIISPPYH